MSEILSAADVRILDQLQRDSSLSTTELSEKVGLSQSPCWRRLQRLREEGYIRKEVALLNRRKFGDTLNIFATLKMKALSDDKRAEFLRKIEVTTEIMECHTIFGERDVMLKIVAETLEQYQQFVFKILLKMPGVEDVQSTVALTTIKEETAIPIRPRGGD
jgi:Lrp/AsnC family transcriptional regulator